MVKMLMLMDTMSRIIEKIEKSIEITEKDIETLKKIDEEYYRKPLGMNKRRAMTKIIHTFELIDTADAPTELRIIRLFNAELNKFSGNPVIYTLVKKDYQEVVTTHFKMEDSIEKEGEGDD